MIVTNGATTNGIPKIGFNTIGIPNVTVSLMLNKPGTNDNVAIALLSSRLPKIMIAITKPIVTPEPPNSPHICKKYMLMIFFGVSPLLNASTFSSANGVNNASFTADNMLLPWIPTNQNNMITK